MLKPKPDAMRMKARSMMEPGIMALNNTDSASTPPNGPAARQRIANQRPIAFARGGKVNVEAPSEKRGKAKKMRKPPAESPAEEAAETPAQEAAEQASGQDLYRRGGKVRKKYAAGGVAKIRHGVANADGSPKNAVPRSKMGRVR